MKKILLSFMSLIFVLTTLISNAQYTNLHNFDNINGMNPIGDLISDGTFLYGMTNSTVFKIKPDGTGNVKLLDFIGPNGGAPKGSLISDGTFLYGTTYGGGTGTCPFCQGTVFKIKPDGTGYYKLLDFDSINGSNPRGSLVSDGTFLYGMTQYGGTNNIGVIFKIKTDGTGYSKLLDFTGTANGNGPISTTLIYDGVFLYGMAAHGGTNNMGVIFKIKTDGTGYVKLLDFVGIANGSYPYGSLISDGTFLYGMTVNGGTNNMGVIFKIKTDGTGYSKLFDFTGISNGSGPGGSLLSVGNFLYGMTGLGGTGTCTQGCGVIFKIRQDGTGYTKLLDFLGIGNGGSPNGSLISDGTFLYGMTNIGGTNNMGTVFKYQYNSNPCSQTFTDTTNMLLHDGINCIDYPIVKIGGKYWMAENVNATQYADGTPISFLNYNNDTALGTVYGKLYDWTSTMNGAASSDAIPSGVMGVCPTGWHLPGDTEWKQLEINLGMSEAEADLSGWRGTIEGGKLKENGNTHWVSPNTGATNSSSFTALPGGDWSDTFGGAFGNNGYTGHWWSATDSGSSAWSRLLFWQEARVARPTYNKTARFSVRCVKDIDFFVNLTILVSKTDATCNGCNDGTATANPSGGTAPYTYQWSNGQTTATATGLVSGFYSVTVTDFANTTATGNITVNQSTQIIYPKITLNASSINVGQSITINGTNFTANGTARVTLQGPAGFSDTINAATSNTGTFTTNYSTSISMPTGNYIVSAKDNFSSLTTTLKSFTLNTVASGSFLEIVNFPSSFSINANQNTMLEFKDKMVLGAGYPIAGSERLYSYVMELSSDGGTTWSPQGTFSNQELINNWILLPHFFSIPTPGTNYKIKITDFYHPSYFVTTPVFTVNSATVTGNLNVQLKWDYSYPATGSPVNGICADGTARIYLDLSKINAGVGSPISGVIVTLDDGGVNAGIDKLGKVMVASNTTSYSSEANGITSLTAANNTPNLSDYYFWYVAPDDFAGNDPDDQSSSNRKVNATFSVTYADATVETKQVPIIIVRPPLMLVHGLGGAPSTWDNFRENLFGNTWNFTNNFKFKTVVPVSIDPSASFASNAYSITKGDAGDLDNSMPGVVRQMRLKGYASVKVDYIGHSMGGLILRYALNHFNNIFTRSGSISASNLPYKNYESGYVNKIITLGTPHDNSPLADIINRYVGGIPTWASLTLESWYGFADKPFPFYFIKPTNPNAWIWHYEPTNAVMDLRVNGGVPFYPSNVKAHLIAGDIFPGEQANLPSGLIPQDIIDGVHNSPGNFIEQFVNYLFQVAKINETDPILHQAVQDAISNVEPVGDALSFLENLTLAMDAFNYGTFVPESDLVVGLGSQLAGFSRTEPNVTVIDNFVAHSSPMPKTETNNLQIGNAVMQLLNDPISSNKFAGFPDNSSRQAAPQFQPLTNNPYYSIRDTTMLKLMQPTDSSSYAVDTNINVLIKLLDTVGLKTLNVYFQGKTYPINDFGTSDIIINLQVNSNELNWRKLVVEGYYNYTDSAKLVYDERTLAVLPNDSLIGFTASPDLIQLAINQLSFADYKAHFVHFNTPIATNDYNISLIVNDTNIVAIDNFTRGFKGKHLGQTFVIVTYAGISDTIYFNVSGCVGSTVNILSAGASICTGDTLELTADNGIHFDWSTGDSTQIAKVTLGGDYSVFAIDSNGCLATASISIIEKPLPAIPVISTSGSISVCFGNTVTLISNYSGGNQWSTNAVTDSIVISSSGNYFLTVTDSSGCFSVSAITTVTINPLPATPTITANGTTLTSSSTTGNQWYLDGIIITNATSQNYIVTQNGNYTVSVTINGCASTSAAFTATGIQELAANNTIIIIPNPSKGKFRIEMDNLQILKIIIYNTIGEIVYESKILKEIDLSSQPKGAYLIEVTTPESVYNKKLLIE